MKTKEDLKVVRIEFILLIYEQDTESEMERLQRDINAILEQGENYARDIEENDPEKAARIRKQMDVLKVQYFKLHLKMKKIYSDLILFLFCLTLFVLLLC